MINEMIRIGAAIAQMDQMVGNQIALPPTVAPGDVAMVVSELAKPHSIVVDQSGQRCLSEAQSYMSFCQIMRVHHKTVPAVLSWVIFDSQYTHKYMVVGTMPGSKKPPAWYDNCWLKTADTIVDLAGQCSIDPAALVASTDRFNVFVRKGIDKDFGRGSTGYHQFLGDRAQKPSPSLGTVEQGPFYAYQSYPGDVGTYGGVITKTDARVLREDGSPIAGLYATGTSTASVMGRAYPGAGSSVGPSFVWDYLAACHAAAAESRS